MGLTDLPVGSRLYLDANVLVYAVEALLPWSIGAGRVLQAVAEGRVTGVTSELSLAECLAKPMATGRSDLVTAHLDLFDHGEGLAVVQIDRETLIRAAQLRGSTALKLPDALRVATALEQQCRVPVTEDVRLQRVGVLPVLSLDEV